MRRTLLVLGAFLAAACNEKGPSTRPEDAVVGHYTLRTINGFAPPQVIAEDSTGTLSILSGDVFLNANNFVDSTVVQFVSDSGTVTESDVGTGVWRLSNDTVFFRTSATNEYDMVLSGTELRQDFFGIILVYRK